MVRTLRLRFIRLIIDPGIGSIIFSFDGTPHPPFKRCIAVTLLYGLHKLMQHLSPHGAGNGSSSRRSAGLAPLLTGLGGKEAASTRAPHPPSAPASTGDTLLDVGSIVSAVEYQPSGVHKERAPTATRGNLQGFGASSGTSLRRIRCVGTLCNVEQPTAARESVLLE